MTYHNDILCCTKSDFSGICETHKIEYLLKSNQISRVGDSKRGRSVRIVFKSLPLEYQEKPIEKNSGNPERTVKHQQFCDEIELDLDAVDFYKKYKPAGTEIKPDKQRQLVNEASVLNAIAKRFKAHLKTQASGSKDSKFWQNAVNILHGIKDKWNHRLPTSDKNLKRKFFEYQKDGYRALVSGNYGNQNTRIVNENIENLLKYIFTQSWKPNYEDVHRDYSDFVSGVKILVNSESGEIYNPRDYELVSVSTVRTYMSKWSNAVGTEKKRSGSKIGYNAKHRSYADLIVNYSGSIISMDDRDMPFKLAGTNKRVVGYFSSDACSGAIVGWAFAKPKMHENDPHGKGMNLIMNCFRNTFEQLNYYGVNMPNEVEVENHLMSTLKESTLKEGNLFQRVRFAAAENPQEKSIEGFFRILRYKYDRKIAGFRPRPSARMEANQSRSGEENIEYTFEQICEIVIENILQYNNDIHSNKKKFKGKTRIEVFLENQNPNLLPIDWRDVSRWVGYSCETSVNRGEVKANNQKFLLPTPELMDKTGIGSKCMAYWFNHESEGENTIYLYKNDEFICKLNNKPKFHKARIEQTEEDFEAMGKMRSFTAKIDNKAKEIIKSLEKVTFIDKQTLEKSTEIAQNVEIFEYEETEFDYKKINRNTATISLLDEL